MLCDNGISWVSSLIFVSKTASGVCTVSVKKQINVSKGEQHV